jgi:hypothetical protein
MSRDFTFSEKVRDAFEFYNIENDGFGEIDEDTFERIKSMPNRFKDIPGTEEAFEKYREIIFLHYKKTPNKKVILIKKMIKALQMAVEEYENSPEEELYDS